MDRNVNYSKKMDKIGRICMLIGLGPIWYCIILGIKDKISFEQYRNARWWCFFYQTFPLITFQLYTMLFVDVDLNVCITIALSLFHVFVGGGGFIYTQFWKKLFLFGFIVFALNVCFVICVCVCVCVCVYACACVVMWVCVRWSKALFCKKKISECRNTEKIKCFCVFCVFCLKKDCPNFQAIVT